MKLTVLLLGFFFMLTSQVNTQQCNVEFKLYIHPEYKNLVLNVSVILNRTNITNWIDFNEQSVMCFLSQSESIISEANTLKALRITKFEEDAGQFVKYKYYNVITELEGFVRCSMKAGNIQIKSNTLFYRFDDYVYVIALTFPSSQNSSEVEVNIEQLINEKHPEYITSVKRVNSVHVRASGKPPITPESDLAGLMKLRAVVQEKVASEYQVHSVRSTRFCPALQQEPYINLPAAISGTQQLSRAPYTYANGSPITVWCVGDFYDGIHWNESGIHRILNSKIISKEPEISQKTKEPEDVFSSTMQTETEDPEDIFKNTIKTESKEPENVFNDTMKLDTQDNIQHFAHTLSNIKNLNARELPALTKKMDSLLSNSPEVIQSLRDDTNTSNHILAALDRVLIDTANVEDGFEQSVQPNFAARVEDVGITSGAGLAVLDVEDAQTRLELVPLTVNSTTEQVLDLVPRAALRLPDNLLENRTDPTSGRLALAVFLSSKIFSELPTSSIVSATLGGEHLSDLSDPVRIWFRRYVNQRPDAGQCVTWDFSANEGRGGWSSQGCTLHRVHELGNTSLVLDECWCWHLTHFGELFTDRPMQLDENNRQVLDFFTQVGCVVSLASLAGVFATAVLATDWLRSPGHKIQLQMSINFALLIVLFLIISSTDITYHVGVIMGILLHYTMLSNFAWMLLAAFLQYSRLVKVVKSRSTRLPLKSGLMGWILPIIPPISLFISGEYHAYSQPPLYLPTGLYFYLTIAMPLCIVMICNIVVFIMIAHNLYIKITIRRHENHCLSLRRFKQLVFLFVLLGFSWLFALCQLVFPQPWSLLFSYLFCTCIALQGFTYFLFFVLMDEGTRNAWRLRFCPSQAKYDVKRQTMRCSRFVFSSGSHDSSGNEISKPRK